MTVHEQSKALAGAAAGFIADIGRHFLAGGEINTLINSGERVLELAATMAIGYAAVYFAPKNAEPTKPRKR